jgi:DNA processing protein
MLTAWLTLAMTEGLGPVLTARLVERAGSAEAASNASTKLLQSVQGIGVNGAQRIARSLDAARDLALHEIENASGMGIDLVHVDDPRYPTLLRQTPASPVVIWVKGSLEPRDLQSIGIVGSRRCSVYGREQAGRFGANLAANGVTVISGGARGVDTAAHVGAVTSSNGRTIAVLGCGVDQVYPPENRDLFDRIVAQGALVSDFPLGTPPLPDNFPRRNRLISGMSRGVLVIEADERSGALITARYAVEDHNRPVFALPGRIDNPLSAGPHRLIRDGAVLVERIGDILDNLGSLPADAHVPEQEADEPALFEPAPRSSGSPERRAILDALTEGELEVEALVDRTGLDVAVVMREITLMSLSGQLRRVDGNRIARVRQ